MKKTFFVKSLLLLFTLIVGGGNAHAQEDYDYQWVKVTDLSEVNTNDIVLLIDVNNKKALSSENDFIGISVTINDNGTIDDDFVQEKESIKWKLTKGQV